MIKQSHIQALGELVIPLLGYFFWEWTLHFVILFFSLDLILGHTFTVLKLRKINLYNPEKNPVQEMRKFAITGTILVLIILFVANVGVFSVETEPDFATSLKNFFFLKEMGIPQGFVLLPLLILINIQFYKITFLNPQRYRTMTVKELGIERRTALFAAVFGSMLAFGIAVLFPGLVPVWVWLVAIVSVKFYFDLKVKY